jgi:hypothetical protein
VAAVSGSAPAAALAASVRGLAVDSRDWEVRLRLLAQDFTAVSNQLTAIDAAGECRVACQKLLDLAGFLQQPGGDPALVVEQIRDMADRIQESAGRVVRKNWRPEI